MNKVSVIVPAYNCEKTIEETINSIEEQTYKNIEVIIVDDGSKDNTFEKCKKLASIYNNIILFYKENGGVSSARNKGLELASGDYISFIDSDDLLKQDMIETLVYDIQNYKADMSICGYIIKNMSGYEKKCYDTNNILEFDKYELLNEFFYEKKIAVSLWNKLFKRKVIENIKFDETLKINEDKLFLFNVILNSNTCVYHDVSKYIYVKRENSATSSQFDERFFDVLKVSKYIKNELKKMSLKNSFQRLDEIKYDILVYRMLILSDNSSKYGKESIELRNEIKSSKIKIKEMYNFNRIKGIELFLIKYIGFMFKPISYIMYNKIRRK